MNPTEPIVAPGVPKPKGSLKHVRTRKGKTVLIPQVDARAWTRQLTQAAMRWAASHDCPISHPVSVEAVFTVPRPVSVHRTWPSTRSSGDIDKLARLALDCLTEAGVWVDDAQVVRLYAVKHYPDGGGFTGATIHIWNASDLEDTGWAVS